MGLVPECTEEDAVAEAKEFNSLSDTLKTARRAAEEKKRTDAIAAAVAARANAEAKEQEKLRDVQRFEKELAALALAAAVVGLAEEEAKRRAAEAERARRAVEAARRAAQAAALLAARRLEEQELARTAEKVARIGRCAAGFGYTKVHGGVRLFVVYIIYCRLSACSYFAHSPLATFVCFCKHLRTVAV